LIDEMLKEVVKEKNKMLNTVSDGRKKRIREID
jgi:hypothetical protein